MTDTAAGTQRLTRPDNGVDGHRTTPRRAPESWRHFSSICRRAICNAGSVTRSPFTWTPCAIRAAPRTSARRCGSSTPAGVDGRPSPRWRRTTRPTADLAAAPILGVAYGYCGAPDQWWQQQVVQGLHRVGADSSQIAELMTSYFELTELHIAAARPGPRAWARRWPGGCSPTAANLTCCCPRRRSTAKPTGPGGCTAGSGSPTSSAATTSPAIPAPSPSSAGRCRCEPTGLAR